MHISSSPISDFLPRTARLTRPSPAKVLGSFGRHPGRNSGPRPAQAGVHGLEPGPSLRLFKEARRHAQRKQYEEGRLAFEELLSREPNLCKGWVSYAQMEKRFCKDNDDMVFTKAKKILQRAMTINPNSACLAQAWGLLELQCGNEKGATHLLERSVRLDPELCSPVLSWVPVRRARQNTVSNRKSRSRR